MPQVAVLGAGVVGLSTAIRAQQAGHTVTIIADVLPGDSKAQHTTHYTSPYAGAHHVSHAQPEDPRQQELDRETFHEFWRMSDKGSDAEGCFMRLQQTEFYGDKQPRPASLEALGCMPELRYLEPEELIEGAADGVTFRTVTIDTPVYLPFLLSKFLGSGGRVVRTRVQHIDQVISGAFSAAPDAVFVCTGLGARLLGGVEDPAVHPIRGQTVLIRAPWVKFGRTLSTKEGLWTYVIPRRSGDVILGGAKEEDDWYPHPRPEMTEDILQRVFAIAPEIAPPESREGGRKPTLDDVRKVIIEYGCGFRPGRTGGIRLEREWRMVPRSEKKVAIIHNYGHGGQGYQSSWGSASKALALLGEALRETQT